MFTNSEAQYLIDLPKKIEHNGGLIDNFLISQEFPFVKEFKLFSIDDADYSFQLNIDQSKKNKLKLTLYLMEDDTKLGLIRVDFSGQHKNPEIISDKVPAKFHPFAGKWFNYSDHHIHYFIEGYRTSLDWALPLTADSFPIKEIENPSDIVNAILEFNKKINLETYLNINPLLI